MAIPTRPVALPLVLLSVALSGCGGGGGSSSSPPPSPFAATQYAFLSEFGSTGTGGGQLVGPSGLALDAAGNIFVVDGNNDRVEVFTGDGTYRRQFATVGPTNSTNPGANFPVGVAVGADGTAYVTLRLGTVDVFRPDGTLSAKFDQIGNVGPDSVAVDPGGDLFVTASFDCFVAKMIPTGSLITQFGTSGSGDGQFQTPLGVAVDPGGHVYVADNRNHRVEVFTEDGAYLSQFRAPGGQFSPISLALDPAGNLYVGDDGSAQVDKFRPNGDLIAQFSITRPGDQVYNSPAGVAVDSQGDVFVADTGNNRVEVFSPAQ